MFLPNIFLWVIRYCCASAAVHGCILELLNKKLENQKWISRRGTVLSSFTTKVASLEAGAAAVSNGIAESDVLKSLSQIIDPDFGTDIVSCGFVKDYKSMRLWERSFRA
ncbi:fe-S cluster assembly factor HCF101, chloroplastic-like [Rosa chinensis]|uniref:fe-S cluster assembly factor HCF101, chloroplastic-like n=1 Tax=Rosa chinensis TaxID=74649 RepID=UPI001AD8BE55|nr:fe-S cluster assembly factor HCF101, chloroplastic-like [Rosa chinensis]